MPTSLAVESFEDCPGRHEDFIGRHSIAYILKVLVSGIKKEVVLWPDEVVDIIPQFPDAHVKAASRLLLVSTELSQR